MPEDVERRRARERRWREEHREEARAYQKAYWDEHRERRKEINNAWSARNRERTQERIREQRRGPDGDRIRAEVRARKQRDREAALRHYAGGDPACSCCGERAVEFLCLDHINGGGNEERKRTGLTGAQFMARLRVLGYPPGYRVLCHNCNLALGFYGYCPHQRQGGVACPAPPELRSLGGHIL